MFDTLPGSRPRPHPTRDPHVDHPPPRARDSRPHRWHASATVAAVLVVLGLVLRDPPISAVGIGLGGLAGAACLLLDADAGRRPGEPLLRWSDASRLAALGVATTVLAVAVGSMQ